MWWGLRPSRKQRGVDGGATDSSELSAALVSTSSGSDPKGGDEATGTPGFAPGEPTDERVVGDWKSRYDDPEAQAAIRIEALFVWLCLALTLTLAL